MPFIKTPKGNKNQFTVARLSSILSSVYLEVYGKNISEKRSEIQSLTLNIWKNLTTKYGEDYNDEWHNAHIKQCIENEIKLLDNFEIHETFLLMDFKEFYKKKTLKKKIWHGFNSEPKKSISENEQIIEEQDPVWAIRLVDKDFEFLTKELYIKNTQHNEFKKTHKENNNIYVDNIAQIGKATKYQKLEEKTTTKHIIEIRRSEWIIFWQKFISNEFSFNPWKTHILTKKNRKTKTLNEWWLWWQKQIDDCLPEFPQIYHLRRMILEKKKRASITNNFWMGQSYIFPDEPFYLSYTPEGQKKYKNIAITYLKRLFGSTEKIDWEELHKTLEPKLDKIITWEAWNHLESSGCLKQINDLLSDKTIHNIHINTKAKELPQWAWMRVAISISLYDKHIKTKEKMTKKIILLYEQISNMKLIPSSAIVREAGKDKPRFFEDYSWSVNDDFIDIQNVIYNAAVNTMWTGTSASDWSKVRSKNAPVKSGVRQSTGVNDFLKTINAHLKSQGRSEEDRPISIMLPIWHRDVREFISLRCETDGDRLQTVIQIPDLFMKRVAEGGTWNIFDPYIYPDVLNGEKGYLKAEKSIELIKKEYPNAHKTFKAEKLWKKLLTVMSNGTPFVTFIDNDKCFSISDDLKILNGLDGVGTFPLDNKKSTISNNIQWPVMAFNLNKVISEQGEPLLNQWKKTLQCALWTYECLYDACYTNLSKETKDLRPICLGTVGFYEALQKATRDIKKNNSNRDTWIYQISETWATLITVLDQTFCSKFGAAPIWKNNNIKLRPYHPQKAFERFKKQRQGGIGAMPLKDDMSDIFNHIKAHRFSVRTVWAPFKQASIWSGVSPGGFGSIFPFQWVYDEKNILRLTPSSFFISKINNNDINEKDKNIFRYPENINKWPEYIKKLSHPDNIEWKKIFRQSSIVRPWVDQGVSVTLPEDLKYEELSILIKQAWWMGINNIRFENPIKKPD